MKGWYSQSVTFTTNDSCSPASFQTKRTGCLALSLSANRDTGSGYSAIATATSGWVRPAVSLGDRDCWNEQQPYDDHRGPQGFFHCICFQSKSPASQRRIPFAFHLFADGWRAIGQALVLCRPLTVCHSNHASRDRRHPFCPECCL